IDIHYEDRSLAAAWKPVVFHGFDENPEEEGDFPSLIGYSKLPVMSQRAWDVLRPIIGYCCEALPTIHPSGETYYIVHVMETIDCLDVARSEINRSQIGDRRINRVYRYAFLTDMLKGKHIFKLPLVRGAGLIVDDVFRTAVETNGLRGLKFEKLPTASTEP